jgi:hypothetical protein
MAVGITYLALMYGWGLTPVSWGWIIGASVAQGMCFFFSAVLDAVEDIMNE